MMNPQAIARVLIQQNPDLQNHPGIQAILNNDSTAGQQYAQNLCQTYGATPQDALTMSKQFFASQFPAGAPQPMVPNNGSPLQKLMNR